MRLGKGEKEFDLDQGQKEKRKGKKGLEGGG